MKKRIENIVAFIGFTEGKKESNNEKNFTGNFWKTEEGNMA